MDQAAVHQMVQQMVAQQVAQLQQQHAQQLQQAIANLAPPAAPAPVAVAPHLPGPRLPLPAVFEGVSAKLDDFIADVEQQAAWYPLPAGEVMRFAAGLMRGAARDWWMAIPVADRPLDWPGMAAALRARFQPITSADTARSMLLALNQGKRSIHDHIDDFRRLLIRVPSMSADDRFFQFRRSLRPAIAMQLDMQGITTLDVAITRAAQIGGRLEGAAQQAASSSSSSSQHAPMDLDAMDSIEGLERDTADDAPITRSEMKLMLAAMQDKRRQGGSSSGSSSGGNRGNRSVRFAAGPPTIPHLSPEQVKEYMDAGKCFGCGSKDHRSRGCPKRKVVDGRVSWSN
jgi:hypothetical protein